MGKKKNVCYGKNESFFFRTEKKKNLFMIWIRWFSLFTNVAPLTVTLRPRP